MSIELFKYLDIETSSYCNRRCPTCIRNSHPNRISLAPRFRRNYLSKGNIQDILTQSIDMGFNGDIVLSFYNEPLLDPRIVEISKMARSFPNFRSVYFHSNGDYITEELANKLDGALDRIIFSLYMDEPMKSERGEWIKSLFKKTKAEILFDARHMITHYSPLPELAEYIRVFSQKDCITPHLRCSIGFDGKYLLCCDDVIGEFDLGRFPKSSLKDYWFGDKHLEIIEKLKGYNRMDYPYCSICPRS